MGAAIHRFPLEAANFALGGDHLFALEMPCKYVTPQLRQLIPLQELAQKGHRMIFEAVHVHRHTLGDLARLEFSVF